MKIDIAKFGDEAMDVIRSGELFDEASTLFLNENILTSADVWKRVQRGRTDTELRHSVLNELMHPTADSKYWQVYREANVQFEALVFASYEWKENQADLEIMEAEKEGLREQLDAVPAQGWKAKKIIGQIKKKEIEMQRKKMMMMSAKASAEDRIRELKALYKIRDELLPQLRYGTENPNDHQLISYAQSLTMRVKNAMDSGQASASEINNLRGTRDSCLLAIVNDPAKLNAFMNGLPEGYQKHISEELGLVLLPDKNAHSDHRLSEGQI